MKKTANKCRIAQGEAVDLKKRATLIDPVYGSKEDYAAKLEAHRARLSALQETLYSTNSHALLIIFQAMDAAGKDGCIKHVMSGVNPQGCAVFSYSHPSAMELKHDFLWRTTRDLPERGKIGIFNRSYYEEVLIVRVHPRILEAESVADCPDQAEIWKNRFKSIVAHERHLHENGTRIVKIFLHLSKGEQRKRLLDRIDTPAKNWKIQSADVDERHYWSDYRAAYEDCLSATSTKFAPWHVVPADDKPTARLIVSQIIVDTLEALDLRMPEINAKRQKELAAMREALSGT